MAWITHHCPRGKRAAFDLAMANGLSQSVESPPSHATPGRGQPQYLLIWPSAGFTSGTVPGHRWWLFGLQTTAEYHWYRVSCPLSAAFAEHSQLGMGCVYFTPILPISYPWAPVCCSSDDPSTGAYCILSTVVSISGKSQRWFYTSWKFATFSKSDAYQIWVMTLVIKFPKAACCPLSCFLEKIWFESFWSKEL